nr:uncharacterized protein LOC105471806 isoform X2 [Macaca nemestrina]XP_011722849.1 uncharacterized protein LOC105471806 isoform X2 [Macaca nemestrina]XP_024645617.1 uncharacterized protein LOC105471806 isoform X2 [Macaca nemestrina]
MFTAQFLGRWSHQPLPAKYLGNYSADNDKELRKLAEKKVYLQETSGLEKQQHATLSLTSPGILCGHEPQRWKRQRGRGKRRQEVEKKDYQSWRCLKLSTTGRKEATGAEGGEDKVWSKILKEATRS